MEHNIELPECGVCCIHVHVYLPKPWCVLNQSVLPQESCNKDRRDSEKCLKGQAKGRSGPDKDSGGVSSSDMPPGNWLFAKA